MNAVDQFTEKAVDAVDAWFRKQTTVTALSGKQLNRGKGFSDYIIRREEIRHIASPDEDNPIYPESLCLEIRMDLVRVTPKTRKVKPVDKTLILVTKDLKIFNPSKWWPTTGVFKLG